MATHLFLYFTNKKRCGPNCVKTWAWEGAGRRMGRWLATKKQTIRLAAPTETPGETTRTQQGPSQSCKELAGQAESKQNPTNKPSRPNWYHTRKPKPFLKFAKQCNNSTDTKRTQHIPSKNRTKAKQVPNKNNANTKNNLTNKRQNTAQTPHKQQTTNANKPSTDPTATKQKSIRNLAEATQKPSKTEREININNKTRREGDTQIIE